MAARVCAHVDARACLPRSCQTARRRLGLQFARVCLSVMLHHTLPLGAVWMSRRALPVSGGDGWWGRQACMHACVCVAA